MALNALADSFKPSISGRTPRRNFWWAYVFYAVIGIGLDRFVASLTEITITEAAWNSAQFIVAACYVAMGILSFFVTIRRLHDIGRSGWWSIGWLIPGISFILFLFLGFSRGDRHPNAYGPSPYDEDNIPVKATPAGTVDALTQLSQLRNSGALTQAEYEEQKKKILAS